MICYDAGMTTESATLPPLPLPRRVDVEAMKAMTPEGAIAAFGHDAAGLAALPAPERAAAIERAPMLAIAVIGAAPDQVQALIDILERGWLAVMVAWMLGLSRAELEAMTAMDYLREVAEIEKIDLSETDDLSPDQLEAIGRALGYGLSLRKAIAFATGPGPLSDQLN